MHRHRQLARTAALTVLAVLASLLTFVSSALAAESIPTLKWPAVNLGADAVPLVSGQDGSVTQPCTNTNGGSNTITYSATGALVRNLDRTAMIDGVNNCIPNPVVGKNGDIYGNPWNMTGGGYGLNLLAYSGNTLKWKYPASCGNSNAQVVAGADGNIYVTTNGHLIGLKPDLTAGQTQPTKVLDVTIPSDCSTMLQAYKDGLVLLGQNSGNARYYSYAGKFLGQATIGDIWKERLNADGKLFIATTVSGTPVTAQVSMYDPRTGQVAWSTTASTPSAGATAIQIYPVAGGGAVARVTEQRMLAGGIPASPTVYVSTLAVINAAGVVTRRFELDDSSYTSTDGSITGGYGSTYILPDTQGNIGVVRELNLNTGIQNPRTVAATDIRLYNIANNNWPYQQIMRGDLTTTGGPNGYRIQINSTLYPVAITSNTMYIPAKCFGNGCANYAQNKLYPIQIAGLGMDYPRGEVLAANAPTQPVPGSYVALGDSYSSGEGVMPFESGTNTSADQCHRSTLAYARLVALNPNVAASLDSGKFAACSGAKTEQIQVTPTPVPAPTYNTESLQVTNLNTNTKVVTVTIGGNDVGVVEFGTECVTTTCKKGSGIYSTTINKINLELPGKLEATYKKILEKAPNAQIYVLGYPQVAPDKTTGDPEDTRCSYLYNSGYDATGTIPMYWADAQAARDIVTSLNSRIELKVIGVRAMNADNLRLHFVPVNDSGSPFAGHTVCSDPGESYFNNLNEWVGHPAYALHPNARGQKAYADLASAAMMTP